MLRRRGMRFSSITEHADCSPTGKLLEAIIESVDEFYCEYLFSEALMGRPYLELSASQRISLASRFEYKVSDHLPL